MSSIIDYQNAEMTFRMLTPIFVFIISILSFTNDITSNTDIKRYMLISSGILGIIISVPSTLITEFLRNRITKIKKQNEIQRELPLSIQPLHILQACTFSTATLSSDSTNNSGVSYINNETYSDLMKDFIPFKNKWGS